MTQTKQPPETVTVHIPFRIVKRGGRKEMQLPDGTAPPRRTDNTLVKALARAFRWKRMLESGEYATIVELAALEGIAPSYMTRVLRLTLLAPDVVEAILDGRSRREVALAQTLAPFPVEWEQQKPALGRSPSDATFRQSSDRPSQRVFLGSTAISSDLPGTVSRR